MTDPGWTLAFRPYALVWLVLVIVVAGIAWYAYRSTVPPVSGRWRHTFWALRTGAIILIAIVAVDPRLDWRGHGERKQHVALLVDVSESMSISDAYGSRPDIVRGLLDGSGLSHLKNIADLELLAFSTSVEPLDRTDLTFDGEATALGEAISDQRRRLPAPDRILLISDGVNTAGTDPIRAASETMIPIHSIGVGDPLPQPDLRVTGVSAPDIAVAGNEVSVTATIENIGIRQQTVPVRIVSGSRTLVSRQIQLPSPGSRLDVTLQFTPESEGVLRAAVEVEAVAEERLTHNNARPFAIDVRKAKRAVLVIARSPSADVAFWMRHFGVRDDIRARLWLTSELGNRGLPSPLHPDSLAAFDMVVWHDVPHRSLSERDIALIVEHVRAGGGLLAIPGRWPLPDVFTGVVPISSTRGSHRQEAIQTAIPLDAARHPVFSEDTDFARWSLRWDTVPPLRSYTAGMLPKTDATVILTGDGRPVSIAGRYHEGRVIVFTGTTYWRWSMIPLGLGADDLPGNRFWNAVTRWLSTRQAVDRVRLQAHSHLYRHGEPVRLTARVYDESYLPLDGADVRVVVGDGIAAATAVPSGPGMYEARITSLEPGDYSAMASATHNGATLGTAEAEFSISAIGVELEETRQDREVLEQIARLSGGRYAPASEADSVIAAMDLPAISEPRERTIAPSRSPWLLTAIVLLLSAEWIGRRMKGLL